MKDSTPDELLKEIRKLQKQLNEVKTLGPISLLSKHTQEEKEKREKELTKTIKIKASFQASLHLLINSYLKALESSTRYNSPPKRYSEVFATLDYEITLYKKEHGSLPSYSQLWNHLKSSPNYQYDAKTRAIINLSPNSFDRENMRKNLDHYGYSGRKLGK